MSDDQTAKTRAVVEGFYAAVTTGDGRAVVAALADDVMLSEPSFLPYGGEYRSRDDVLAALGTAGSYLQPPTAVLKYVVADGHRAVAVLSVKSKDGTDLVLAEELTVADDRIASIRVYCFEAGELVRIPT